MTIPYLSPHHGCCHSSCLPSCSRGLAPSFLIHRASSHASTRRFNVFKCQTCQLLLSAFMACGIYQKEIIKSPPPPPNLDLPWSFRGVIIKNAHKQGILYTLAWSPHHSLCLWDTEGPLYTRSVLMPRAAPGVFALPVTKLKLRGDGNECQD